ncbi:MAG: isoamylase early set domain-containing protein [Ferruginibacter sp.]
MTNKISFILPAESVADASSGVLVGEFNNWNPAEGIYLQKQEDGSMIAELALTPGKTYEYRYLLSDGRWVNDNNAKSFSDNYDVENCVINVPEVAEMLVAVKPKVAKVAKKTKEVVAVIADEFTKIEGINKKVEALLTKENIKTFKDLGKNTIKNLQLILDGAGSKFSIYNPATWPKQAKLAAAGKWEELNKWQEELKAVK